MIIHKRVKVVNLISTLTLIVGHTSARYVYRGESMCHEDVGSSLYRAFYEIDNQHFDIMEAQRRQLEQAKLFTKETDELRVLAEIQHRGGKTNLIDFTTDMNIALFFACRFSNDTDGRIIFLRYQKWEDYTIHRAVQPSNMADSQKSVFVIPKKGYIKDTDVLVYPIPSDLKADILQYLECLHGLTMATVYNDIAGFIRHQEEYQDFEAEYYAAQRSLQQGEYGKAVDHSSNYLRNRNWAWSTREAYYIRGAAHWNQGNQEQAIDDFMASGAGNVEGLPDLPLKINKLLDSKRKKEEEERQRQALSHVEKGIPNVTHRILVESRDQHGNLTDWLWFELLCESGYSYKQRTHEGTLTITVPTECVEGRWWFWFNKDGYRGVNAIEVVWGEPFTITMQPKEKAPSLPVLTVKVTYIVAEADS